MDRQIREGARPTGENDIEKQAHHLAELMRSGELAQERVAFMAFLGHEPAKTIFHAEETTLDHEAIDNHTLSPEFFQDVIKKFGLKAYTTLMLGPLEKLSPLFDAYVKQNGLELQSGLDDVIDLLKKYLDTENKNLSDTLNEVIQANDKISNDWALLDGSVDEEEVDLIQFGLLPLEVVRELLKNVATQLMLDIGRSGAVLQTELIDSLLLALQRELRDEESVPVDYLLEVLPESLQDYFHEREQLFEKGEDEWEMRCQKLSSILLKMMKDHAMQWVLEDLKTT